MLLLLFAAAASPGAPLTVAVTGIASAQGLVHVDICPPETFAKDGKTCPWAADVPATPGTTLVTFRDIPPGRYGAQASHDRNGNRKVDRGLFGIPSEPVGFSNDAAIRFGPPKFAAAAFIHGGAPQTITFKVRSLP